MALEPEIMDLENPAGREARITKLRMGCATIPGTVTKVKELYQEYFATANRLVQIHDNLADSIMKMEKQPMEIRQARDMRVVETRLRWSRLEAELRLKSTIRSMKELEEVLEGF